MPAQRLKSLKRPGSAARLSPAEVGVVELFVRLTQVLAVPKSLGEIYGLLFISAAPVTFEEIVQRLNISSGSASSGLRVLRGTGAIRTVYVAGDRRDHYAAEIELRKLAAGFLRIQLGDSLTHGDELLTTLANPSPPAPDPSGFLADRLRLLHRWHQQAKSALPLILNILEN